MKLKKIASLALAGIMAVSMLAGCKDGGNGNSGSSSSENTNTNTGVSAEILNLADISNRKDIIAVDNSKLNSAVEKMAETSAAEWAPYIKNKGNVEAISNSGNLKLMINQAKNIMAGATYVYDATGTWGALNAKDGADDQTIYNFYYASKGLGESVINNLIADELDSVAFAIGDPNPGAGDSYQYTVSVAKADWKVGKDADASVDGVIIGVAVKLDYTEANF